VIGRTWIQELGGHRPHPPLFLCGQAPQGRHAPGPEILSHPGCWVELPELTLGSPLLHRLNARSPCPSKRSTAAGFLYPYPTQIRGAGLAGVLPVGAPHGSAPMNPQGNPQRSARRWAAVTQGPAFRLIHSG